MQIISGPVITFKTGIETTWQPEIGKETSKPLGFFKYRDDEGVSQWYKALGTMFYSFDSEIIEAVGGYGAVGSWTAERVGGVETENGWHKIVTKITYCHPVFSDCDPWSTVTFTVTRLKRKPKGFEQL